MNDVTDSNEKHNIESESQKGVVINKATRKNKNGWIGRCLPLVQDMQLEKENWNNKLKGLICNTNAT